ncbi:hypothetical protein HG471_000460 [Candidatus Saccharibacteria bacterium]|nr:hypothetical protein [Candidatus Saccharibacteria bacterium]
MAQVKTSKSQSSSDNKLFIAVIICIGLVVAGFIGSFIMIDKSFVDANIEYQRHFGRIQFRIREINLRLQNNPKNEEEIEMLNDTVENDK